ncbi:MULTISPECIES: DUF5655 domain-containing protein [Xanthomonas]|uniref:DUF5655 domain-containing protein n=1 Tax=Xanthomonas TaxID=338 RepID=UPI00307BA308
MKTRVWACPNCNRQFTRTNQRHACGTGDRCEILRGRPADLVELYTALETFMTALGAVECVTRERYVLFRSCKVFADATIMTDAIRLAVHLGRRVDHAMFIKSVTDRKQVTQIAKLHTRADLEAIKIFLHEAYEHSITSRAL